MVAYKQFQAAHGPMRALCFPGAWAFASPAQPERLGPQQVLYEDAGALEARLPAIEDFFRSLGVRFWRVYVPRGDTAAERLLTHARYEPREAMPAMGMSLAGAALEAPRVTLEQLPTQQELIPLNAEAFGDPKILLMPWHHQSYAPMHSLGLREGGQLLSCGMAFDAGDTTGIYLVATATSARGRGLASEVTRGLLLEAQARGQAAAVLQATALGRGVYQRVGLRDVGVWNSWVHVPR
jgi:ribosomal protein S18 acetylase RimI-like enzyme